GLEVVAALGLVDPLLDPGDAVAKLLRLVGLAARGGEGVVERGDVVRLEAGLVAGLAGEAIERLLPAAGRVGEPIGGLAVGVEAVAPVADDGFVVGAEAEAVE